MLWLSKANIEEKVTFLESEFELDDDDLRDLFVTYPKILGLSIKTNLRKKIDFFLGQDSDGDIGDVGLSRQKLKELVLYQVCICLSMDVVALHQ